MRQGCRQAGVRTPHRWARRAAVCAAVGWAALVLACSAGLAVAQSSPPSAIGGSVTAPAAAGGPVPYWQAPALPKAVIQGGAIPAGWTPQAVPYTGIGPDGKPMTSYFAPTYTFTYPVGPPVPAAPGARPVPVNRRQAPGYQPPAAYAPGWNYQPQGMPPPAYAMPPPMTARYAPQPYRYPPGAQQLGGAAVVPPVTAAPAPSLQPALQPPPGFGPPPPAPFGQPVAAPPSQWVPAPTTAPPTAGQGFAAAAPPAIAAAGAVAAQQSSAVAAASPAAPVSTQPAGLSPLPSSGSGRARLWRVVGVYDGDTIGCLDENNQEQKIRLAELDAPEMGQDYGQVARSALSDMVFGKTVEFRDEGMDRSGRWIGHLVVNGTDVNRQMIATGNAWHYAAYSKDASLAAAQEQAKAQRLGLWAQPNPIPPWEFRATERARNSGA